MLDNLKDLKKLYRDKINIINYLKEKKGKPENDAESILISYDFQAGSYIERLKNNYGSVEKYTSALARLIDLFSVDSICEVGVGEATTLANVVVRLNKKPQQVFGFDLSWSRIKYAQHYMRFKQVNGSLFTGDLFYCPIANDSIDLVYTSHSIESNGGREREALRELYRITRRYLILLEPAYEFANEDGQVRMAQHGYVKNLYEIACDLGFKVIEYRLFDFSFNPLNPTGLIIIEKSDCGGMEPLTILACPFTKTRLKHFDGVYFSRESLLSFPVIAEIPCLLPENAVVTSHFDDILGEDGWV